VSSVELNTAVPHSARIYDYLLGGKDNFEADRAAAAAIVRSSPNLPVSMRANRQYMARVAHYLAADLGIRQFLDIGTGLPTAPNLHEVVQAVAPESRVVYVDNDPIVLVHARALLTTAPPGRTAYIAADLRDVKGILESDDLVETLDLTKPVAVSMIAILQFITDDDVVRAIIDEVMAPMPPGSALAISTVTAHNPEAVRGAEAYKASGIPARPRTDAEIAALFGRLELIEPGITLVNRWRPDAQAAAVDDDHVLMSGGVAVKR
jgi:O-methyltransferase involved in polyketide biosynthesis